MRKNTLWPIITLFFTALLLTLGCNDGVYYNPTSPPADTTEWRTLSVDATGGIFDFPDIGAMLTFPADAIPVDETYTLRIRLFPQGIPMVPGGPIMVRLGSFELVGPADIEFLQPVDVQYRIAVYRTPGADLLGYALDSANRWQYDQKTLILNDGMHVIMHITRPGIYGSFQTTNLHVEATVNSQAGPAPLSVAFKALIIGGTPPYDEVWIFGDNSDNMAGLAVSHMYKDPAVYNPSIMVTDSVGNTVTDTLMITVYNKNGPANLP